MSFHEKNELSFVRCKNCRSLVVSTATKCRICNAEMGTPSLSSVIAARMPKPSTSEPASKSGGTKVPGTASGNSPKSTSATVKSDKTAKASNAATVDDDTITLSTVLETLAEQERRKWLSIVSGQIKRSPLKRFPEPPMDYWIEEMVWRQICLTIEIGSTSLLVGPAGTGKTEIVINAAESMNRPLFIFSCGSMSEPRSSLIGSTHFDPKKGTYFVESRFVRAIQQPNAVILLDELNRCDPDTYNIFLPLLDGQRVLPLDEDLKGRVCKVAEGVVFMGTANIGVEYAGTRRFDRALQDRFAQVLQIRFPPFTAEAKLLEKRHRIDSHYASILTRMASQQRSQHHKGEYEFPISTRMLLATARQISLGVDVKEAIEFTLTAHFSPAGGDLSDSARFRQLVQRFLQ